MKIFFAFFGVGCILVDGPRNFFSLMEKKNKSAFCFKLMKKKPKKKTKQIDRSKILLINLCIKRGHSKYFVVEKIGSIDIKKNIFFLNFFRFIY